MIRGIGIDVVHTDRLRDWVDRPGLLARYLHPGEVRTVASRGEAAVLSIATRFAAKEAFAKALGVGLRGFELRDVEVRNDALGKPEIVLHGKAAAALEKSGGTSVFVSLTHEEDYAIAMVVIEGS
ncbi:MAG TPA: holo-ACP synthase [Spirochaetia bacterium]|nr:holo-ACP synthase [Spirochaetia bacterium]